MFTIDQNIVIFDNASIYVTFLNLHFTAKHNNEIGVFTNKVVISRVDKYLYGKANIKRRKEAISFSADFHAMFLFAIEIAKKVQVGKDQEKAQSEKDSHSKNRGGKKPN